MTLTFNHLPQAVSEALQKQAKIEGRSVEEVAIDAIQRGLSPATLPRRRDLSDIAGTWVEDPAFDDAVREFDKIDSDMWK